jgi:hypothetical protein
MIKYDCLYVSGCSFTYGDGLDEKTRISSNWAGLIGEKLNIPVINEGMGGGGNDRIFRTAMTSISKLISENKNPLVIICWTARHRREIFDVRQNNWRVIIPPANPGAPGEKPAYRNEFDEMYFKCYSDDSDDTIRTLSYKIGLQSFLKQQKIKHLYTSVWGLVPIYNQPYHHFFEKIDITDFNLVDLYDKSMELPCMHPNKEAHQLIAARLLEELDKINIE